MARVSARTLSEVAREARRRFGLPLFFMNARGESHDRRDRMGALARVRKARMVAFHESVTLGGPAVFHPAPNWLGAVIPLEDKRIVHGALLTGEVAIRDGGAPVARPARAPSPASEADLRLAAQALSDLFYRVAGWKPLLLEDNRLRTLQQEQLAQAIEDRRRDHNAPTAYPFEKERTLLARIKGGDRNGARRVLNDMLAAMYLSSPKLPVLRARAIELMGYLTRAAVEDSPGMEALIERNHGWMASLILAPDFEALSRVLTQALDEFIEGIYRHGLSRSHTRIGRALDFIASRYQQPIALRDVAQAAGLSRFRLAHLMKELTGRTVLQTILDARIAHARRLLDMTDRSCGEIAYEAGFNDQSYFTRQFSRAVGVTPARYRRRRQLGQAADPSSPASRQGPTSGGQPNDPAPEAP